ncbi:universal stress protein [Haloplanus aerogenes]|uniref:Nucleotide-binding universal stress UspA family protein n=1 Tax=Haloplanus aerogenes TaxID=660522 RepID=A0A3M0E9X2_9EURY|nr:universal stress protein [Haloplanus aerogenes]AZH25324.1 universal stress protein [Haloplanus aerogenes]RMB25020.1 nucleotide-binding universal stress UspA family protein [Haloplanus aerogenes]
MAKRLLVPVDGSDPADAALEFALEEYPDADITALSVIDPTDVGYGSIEAAPSTFEHLQDSAEERTEKVLEDAKARAAEHGMELTTETVIGMPSRAIVEWAENNDIDSIVIGSHGRQGVTRVLLGSVAESVVRRSPVPVTVVR